MIVVPWVLGAWSAKLAWQHHPYAAAAVGFLAGAMVAPAMVADLLQRRLG